MQTFAAFLRGINVAGQKSIKMIALKAMMEDLGFEEVQTYIQSGNIFFKSKEKEENKLQAKIKKGILDTFNFVVPVLVWPTSLINKYLKSNPYLAEKPEEARLYYTLLSEKPSAENVEKLMALANDIDFYTVHDKIIYILVNTKYSDSKFSNNMIEKVLKVEATTRNHATMVKMGGGERFIVVVKCKKLIIFFNLAFVLNFLKLKFIR